MSADIFTLVLILGESIQSFFFCIQSFTMKYDRNFRFFINALYQVKELPYYF